MPGVKSVLSVVTNQTSIEANLPSGRGTINRCGAKAIAVTAALSVSATEIGNWIDDRIFFDAPIPADLEVLHKKRSVTGSPAAVIGIPSRVRIAYDGKIGSYETISSGPEDAVAAEAVNSNICQRDMRRFVRKPNSPHREVVYSGGTTYNVRVLATIREICNIDASDVNVG
jgi:hypothetical protein